MFCLLPRHQRQMNAVWFVSVPEPPSRAPISLLRPTFTKSANIMIQLRRVLPPVSSCILQILPASIEEHYVRTFRKARMRLSQCWSASHCMTDSTKQSTSPNMHRKGTRYPIAVCHLSPLRQSLAQLSHRSPAQIIRKSKHRPLSRALQFRPLPPCSWTSGQSTRQGGKRRHMSWDQNKAVSGYALRKVPHQQCGNGSHKNWIWNENGSKSSREDWFRQTRQMRDVLIVFCNGGGATTAWVDFYNRDRVQAFIGENSMLGRMACSEVTISLNSQNRETRVPGSTLSPRHSPVGRGDTLWHMGPPHLEILNGPVIFVNFKNRESSSLPRDHIYLMRLLLEHPAWKPYSVTL